MKTKRQTLLFMIIALATLVSRQAIAQTPFDLGDYGDDQDYTNAEFIITNQKGLAKLAELVNDGVKGKTFEGKTIMLMNPIELTTGAGMDDPAKGWRPIGSDVFSFKGIFDGNEQPISNLAIASGNTVEYRGLFGETEGATIQNLILKDVNIECLESDEAETFFTGAIAGKAFDSQFINCHIINGDGVSKITGSKGTHESSTGGLIGFMDGGEISLCSNSAEVLGADIESTSVTGGLVGVMTAYASPITIRCSFNKGLITGGESDFWSCTGGLIGQFTGEKENFILSDCYNTGNIIGREDTGGLIGYATNWGTDLLITNCFSYADIEGGSRTTGGLIGYLDKQGKEDEDEKSGICTLENCLAILPSFTGPEGLTHLLVGYNADGELNNNYSLAKDAPKYTDTDNRNGAQWNGRTDSPPFRAADQSEIWPSTIWNFDTSHQLMPVFGADMPSGVQENVVIPKWQTVAPVYHIITIDVAPGIDARGVSSGDHVVAENENLQLLFLPENTKLNANDILFLIDGVETQFKDMGGNYYFSYFLNAIKADHTVLIALREYDVTIPEVDGARITPEAGTHKAAYGEPFAFSILPDISQNPDDIKVYSNGTLLELDTESPSIMIHPAPLNYRIEKVTGPIEITVEGLEPTSNTELSNAHSHISTINGQLIIETSGIRKALVYNISGVLLMTRIVNEIETIRLQPGVYVVKVDDYSQKIIIRE